MIVLPKSRNLIGSIQNEKREKTHILKIINFTPERKRMSVICQKHKNKTPTKYLNFDALLSENHNAESVIIYTKGAPENIFKLCTPNSLPKNHLIQLQKLSKKGLRVLALATKEVKQKDFKQLVSVDFIESDLQFLGFILFENPLKEKTTDTITKLNKCGIGTVMITGDNLLTALSVATSCGIAQKNQNIVSLSFNEKDNKFNFESIHESITPLNIIPDLKHFEEFDQIMIAHDYKNHSSKKYFKNLNFDKIKIDPSISANNEQHVYELIKQEEIEEEKRSLHQPQIPNFLNNKEIQNITKKISPNSNTILGMTGDTFDSLLNSNALPPSLLLQTKVFARSSPEQKARIVKLLQEVLGNSDKSDFVGFCGDGANDCSALKTANVGLSLTQTEASIAAPFSTTIDNISCVLELIKEGKCSLRIAVENFQFICFTALAQYIGQIMLYFYVTDFSNGHYYYMDLMFTFWFIILVSRSKPARTLTNQYPPGDLFNFPVMLRLLFSLGFLLCYLIFLCYFLSKSEFFISIEDSLNSDGFGSPNFMFLQNNLIFYVIAWGYMASVFILFQGGPFKDDLYRNVALIILFISHVIFLCFFCFYNDFHVLPKNIGGFVNTVLYYLLFCLNNFVRIMWMSFDYKIFITISGLSTFLFMLVLDKFLISLLIRKFIQNKNKTLYEEKLKILDLK
jgi:cation-transporting ATPase 13A3/4/5